MYVSLYLKEICPKVNVEDLRINCTSNHLRIQRQSVVTVTFCRLHRSEIKMAAEGSWGSFTKCETMESYDAPS